jgi:group I intron endonuclease
MSKPEAQKLIYKVTNKINDLCYIGQTYSRIKNGEEIGHLKRLNEHIRSSKTTKSCPKFHNAIEAHGEENFEIDVLLYASEDEIDEYEKLLISLYGSNKEFGYNIADGGKGVICGDEDTRIKISLTQGSFDMNIREVYRFGKHLGYRVLRRVSGILKQKYFSSQKNSLEENYRLAKIFLNSVINKEPYENNKYNRTVNLPKHIVFYKDKTTKEVRGYTVQIIKDKILYKKNFSVCASTMEEKLICAIKYKEKLQKELGII